MRRWQGRLLAVHGIAPHFHPCQAQNLATVQTPELFPGAEADALGQRLDLGIFQNHELLIGGAFAEEGAVGVAEDTAQLVGGCPDTDVSLADIARLTDAFYIGGTKCGALCVSGTVSTLWPVASMAPAS